MMSVASQADPLGYDAGWTLTAEGLDLDPTGRAATGVELVDAAILARLSCDSLALIDAPGDAVEFGEDVRLWVGEALDDGALASKGPRLAIILQRDQRIATATVTCERARTQTFADGSKVDIVLAVEVTTVTGATLDRIVGVSQITVAFLAQGS